VRCGQAGAQGKRLVVAHSVRQGRQAWKVGRREVIPRVSGAGRISSEHVSSGMWHRVTQTWHRVSELWPVTELAPGKRAVAGH
jgi:hypothetical protein